MSTCKCGWSHCERIYIYDTEEKVKVGKRWYHSECAKERELIQDIITKFNEYVDANADVIVLRKITNELIFTDNYPAEYVMFALDYALVHPEMKLTYPAGMYRICRDPQTLGAWKQKQNKAFMAQVDKSQFVAKEVIGTPTTQKQNKTGGFSSILGKRSN